VEGSVKLLPLAEKRGLKNAIRLEDYEELVQILTSFDSAEGDEVINDGLVVLDTRLVSHMESLKISNEVVVSDDVERVV
jgi:hypothetical protein